MFFRVAFAALIFGALVSVQADDSSRNIYFKTHRPNNNRNDHAQSRQVVLKGNFNKGQAQSMTSTTPATPAQKSDLVIDPQLIDLLIKNLNFVAKQQQQPEPKVDTPKDVVAGFRRKWSLVSEMNKGNRQ